MSKKNIVLAVTLAFVLGASAPVSAMTRDGGGPGFDPIQRIVKMLKKLFTPTTHDELFPTTTHP
jgi:hypothetical protein